MFLFKDYITSAYSKPTSSSLLSLEQTLIRFNMSFVRLFDKNMGAKAEPT